MSTGKPESFSANESVRELRSNFALFLALGLAVGLTAFGLNSLGYAPPPLALGKVVFVAGVVFAAAFAPFHRRDPSRRVRRGILFYLLMTALVLLAGAFTGHLNGSVLESIAQGNTAIAFMLAMGGIAGASLISAWMYGSAYHVARNHSEQWWTIGRVWRKGHDRA